MKSLYLVMIVLLALLPACGGTPQPGGTSTPKPTLAPNSFTPETQTSPPPATLSPTPSEPVKLRLWLPPQFDPAADTPAGKLLRAQLDEFRKRRPGIELEIRVKSVYGPGGLLDALSAASAAAPQAVPDLVALPRDLLEAAALKGLLRPYNNLTKALDDPDWYAYARQLSSLQESIYGLPFAGDALALVYRPETIPKPPADWTVTPESGQMLVFPAADPQALFTLALYQSTDGPVQDDQGRPKIETIALTEVLTYFLQAQTAGMMPELLTQYQSDDQVWDAFQDRRADMAVTWSSRFLGDAAEDRAIAPIPTQDGVPYTLATGWVWALSAPESRGQQAAIELAEFLTEKEFLAGWTEAAGVLPTRPSSTTGWNQAALRSIIDKIARSAHVLPAADILIGLGGPLWQATIDVLNGQTDPATAAQTASSSLTGP
jgi:ABC-type glycerol-3-phosphate transport system substrate-binding protein